MQNGLFNIGQLDQKGDGDVLQANINESGEFAPGSYDKNDVSNHTTSAKVSVPGGDGEAPKAKPEGGEHGPTPPGGDGEKPTAKPEGGERGPSIPKKTELTTDQWNHAMSLLKQSFKEGMEIMEMLESAHIVEETTEQRQERFLQESMDNAYYEAMITGPIFEAAEREDKEELRATAKETRSAAEKAAKDVGTGFKPVNSFARAITSSKLKNNLYQIVGAVSDKAAKFTKALRHELNDSVGKGKWTVYTMDPNDPELVEYLKKGGHAGRDWGSPRIVFVDLGAGHQEGRITVDGKVKALEKKKGSVRHITNSLMEAADPDPDEDDDDKKCPKCGKDPCECDKKGDDKE